MKTVIVASTNPVKIDAARNGFTRMFPGQDFDFIGVQADSRVPDQPMSSDETLQGARNRLNNAMTLRPDGDYWVAIESGAEDTNSDISIFAWAVICDKNGITGKSRSVSFDLPPALATMMRSGKTLGEADDLFFQRTNCGSTNGTIGLLTDDIITRTIFHVDSVICALIPFKKSALYMTDEKEMVA